MKKENIVHIMTDNKYSDDFKIFLGKMYPNEKHIVYITTRGKLKRMSRTDEDCSWTQIGWGNGIKFLRDLEKSKRIYFHGIFSNIIISWLYLNERLLRKTYLLYWGGDLYDHRNIINGTASIKEKIIDKEKKYLLKKCAAVAFDMPTDYDLLKKWYGLCPKVYFITYPQIIDGEFLTRIWKEKNKKGKNWNLSRKIIVQIGNSATKSNRHFEMIDWLSKYNRENIEVICPLSYGDDIYARIVEEYGEKKLRGRFKAVTEYLDINSYSKVLADVDIAIFNVDRQQAMGNITIAGYIGTKVYIRDDTTMWQQYVVNGGCKFYKAQDIKNMEYKDFININEKDGIMNREYFNKIWNMEYMLNTWTPLLKGSDYSDL